MYNLNSRPHFTHDCAACRFIGSLTSNSEVYDIYLHGDSKTGTVIVREGSEGPEYLSCSIDIALRHPGGNLHRAALLVQAIA